jgi:phosphohistidine phosphatase
MKTLFLIRHAKSSWDDTALPDKDRPLGDRGRRDAPKMGKRLAKRDVKPDLILSSPARRALTTAEIVAKKLDYKLKDIVVDDRLYAGAVHDLLNVIHKLGDKLERVMLFGHNPELTEFAHRLSSEITHMPTCAVAEFRLLRPGLAPRDRSLVTVSSLIASGQIAQLTGHLNIGMNNGLTPAEIAEAITHLAFYVGWPNVFSAMPVAKDVFEKRPR